MKVCYVFAIILVVLGSSQALAQQQVQMTPSQVAIDVDGAVNSLAKYAEGLKQQLDKVNQDYKDLNQRNIDLQKQIEELRNKAEPKANESKQK